MTPEGGPPGGPVFSRYDGLLLDLDGVIYRGEKPVPGAGDVLSRVRRAGVRTLFMTNNSSLTAEQVSAKLERLGVPCEPQDVLTSGLATAALLKREGRSGATAFVIGERGLRDALRAVGVAILDGEPDRADLVIVGWDRGADYAKLRRASLLVQRGASLIATNADASYPAPDGTWPGAGALLAAVTTTTGAPARVVGKPAAPMFRAGMEATGSRTPLVVGDRLDTDVRGAGGMGLDSMLVLTGVSDRAGVVRGPDAPTYLASGLAGLLDDRPPGAFEPAVPGDGGALRELLLGAGLEAEGVEKRLAGTVLCRLPIAGAVAATACLQPLGGSALLRSVAVREGLRGRGLGVLAVAAAVRRGRAAGVTRVYALTAAATGFWQALGFQPIDRGDPPPELAETRRAIRECASADVMALDLGVEGRLADSPRELDG